MVRDDRPPPPKKRARRGESSQLNVVAGVREDLSAPCSQCEQSFNNSRGLKIHTTKIHTRRKHAYLSRRCGAGWWFCQSTCSHSLVAPAPESVKGRREEEKERSVVEENMQKDSRNSSLPSPSETMVSGEYFEKDDDKEEKPKPLVDFDIIKGNCYRELADLLRIKEYEEKTAMKELQSVKQKLVEFERTKNSSQQQQENLVLRRKFDDEKQRIIMRRNARIFDIHSKCIPLEKTLLKLLQAEEENIVAIQAQLQKENPTSDDDDEDTDTEEKVVCKIEIIDTNDEEKLDSSGIETRVEDSCDGGEKRAKEDDIIPALQQIMNGSMSC